MESYFIIFHKDKLVLADKSLPQGVESQLSYRYALASFYVVGYHEGKTVYCADWTLNEPLPSPLRAVSVKAALQQLPSNWYALIARAIAIVKWDNNHRFCGRCGMQTERVAHHFEMCCRRCELFFYPRISPSVIVLIEKGDFLLMARSPHFAPGVFGLIAGFIEAGESIEEAVHREVAEEVGLHITNLRYVGSQAWPFPDSLVAAFRASYASGDLVIDHCEIEEAGWYRYDQLPGVPSSSVSIARRLIDVFVKEKQETHS